jgi:hypothetical protein
MAKKSTLDLNRDEYEALCWDTAIYTIKQEEAKRHQKLLTAGDTIRKTVEDFLNGNTKD